MSLSVCVKKVRVISPNGNLLSEGEMKCEDIETLQALNYEIIDLEETTLDDSTDSSLEPVQVEPEPEPVIEELPVETETIQVVEQPKPIYAIYEQDIFDRSITLVEEITNAKANNIILTNENNNLKQQLETFQTEKLELETKLETSITQEEFNQYKLDRQISAVHSSIHSNFSKTKMRSSPEARAQDFTIWVNESESAEIGLENLAKELGLTYNRRKFIPLSYSYSQGETLYYKNHIPNWTIEKWESLP